MSIEITDKGFASSTTNVSAHSYGSSATAQGSSQTYSGQVALTASMSLKLSRNTVGDIFALSVVALLGSALNDWGALGTA